MPIYEFSCKTCGNRFSQLRRMGDDKNIPCPECESTETGKLMSSFASVSSGSACGPSGGG